jgi:tetratricopeptide (TPR) repeat protein
VIYLLYGDQTEGYLAETVFALERLGGGAEIPEFILVGIHNTDRYGDLLPVGREGQPGGADRFMDFLEEELFPFVEAEYRTKPYRLLIGPQAGGAFGLYALIRRPALFNAFVLENPLSAPQSRGLLGKGLVELVAARPDLKASAVINSFDRTGFQDHTEATKALVDLLQKVERVRPSGLTIQRRHLEEPTFVPSLALAARRFPSSWNAHDSLGEAHAAAGRIDDAVRSYEESLRLNPDNRNARAMLEKLRD